MKNTGIRSMLKGALKYIIFLQLFIISSSALSAVEVKEFSSEQMRERFQVLVTELRCPKCQNQNLADSNSPIASDLRDEIYLMLEDGKADREIIDFLVARYGEFVMYRPPVKKTTWILWFVPGILLLTGLVIIFIVRRRQITHITNSATLPANEQVRLAELLSSAENNQNDSGASNANGERK
ncbi:MAG: cytochrome c-type biogenesis protein [Porticoccus sp.]